MATQNDFRLTINAESEAVLKTVLAGENFDLSRYSF